MNHIRKNGIFYGYPECCIESFLSGASSIENLKHSWERTEEQQKVAKEGFIPCEVHAKQILEGKLKIEELILPSRKEERPFLTRMDPEFQKQMQEAKLKIKELITIQNRYYVLKEIKSRN